MATNAVAREKARMRLTARTSAIDQPSDPTILRHRARAARPLLYHAHFCYVRWQVTVKTPDEAGERAAHARFLEAHPEYAGTRVLDDLRASEYGRLDAARHVYLDYTGGGLYADSQIRRHAELLQQHVFGNPHSASPCSTATTTLVEEARRAVLEYFHTSAREYTAIFTLNATGALKLVGESYPFAAGGRYALTFDNHNSVNGIREYARSKGADIDYAPLTM